MQSVKEVTVAALEDLHKETSRLIKQKDFGFNIDEYYDDLEDRFVVKVHHAVDAYKTRHFRASHKIDAWLECYAFANRLKIAKAFFI